MAESLHKGAQIGRYTLLSRCATGGMSDIWLAHAIGASGFKKMVILKILAPRLAQDAHTIQMFVNEALIGSALEHPNIVHVFDHGKVGGIYYIAMEYIAGRTLRAMAREMRRLGKLVPPWFTVHAALAVCDALEYAHHLCDAEGSPLHVVHRDITPDNVMCSFHGVVKLLDFGIAWLDLGEATTDAGMLKGKRAYLAPEEIQAAIERTDVSDPRSDLFSLGVLLYELTVGLRPFEGGTEAVLLREIMGKDPVPPRQRADWIPPVLEAVILMALEKNPNKRFQTAAEMRCALEESLPYLGPPQTERDRAKLMGSLFGEVEPMLSTTPSGTFLTPRSGSAMTTTAPEPEEAVPELKDDGLELELPDAEPLPFYSAARP